MTSRKFFTKSWSWVLCRRKRRLLWEEINQTRIRAVLRISLRIKQRNEELQELSEMSNKELTTLQKPIHLHASFLINFDSLI